MLKNDIRDVIIKFIFVAFGIIFGFAFSYIYAFFPQKRALLFIVFILFILFLVFMFEKIRNRMKYEQKINSITQNIKNTSAYAGISYDEKDIEPFIEELYESIENLRKGLKVKNRILHTVLDIINKLALNIKIENLAEILISRLIDETNSNWGVLYVYNNITEKLELKKSIGLSKKIYNEFDIELGEGFLGTAAISKKVKIYKNIPESTVFENKTFMGKIIPKNIMTVPIIHENSIKAILSFGSMYDYTDEQISLIKTIKNYLGFVLNNCMAYERSQRMSSELQFQNQLIQNMNDELEKKVNDRTEFLNTIMNCIDEYSIISIDKDGYITTWNRGAEKNNGHKDFEVIGKHITHFYSLNDINSDNSYDDIDVWHYYKMAKQNGIYKSKGWKLRSDGTRFFADITIIPVYDNLNKLQGFTTITKDRTDEELLKEDIIIEKMYNQKIIESSNQAIILTDRNGTIINANIFSKNILIQEDIEIKGKSIFEFLTDDSSIEKNIKRISLTGDEATFYTNIIYKHNGIEKIELVVKAISSNRDDLGVIIYINVVE